VNEGDATGYVLFCVSAFALQTGHIFSCRVALFSILLLFTSPLHFSAPQLQEPANKTDMLAAEHDQFQSQMSIADRLVNTGCLLKVWHFLQTRRAAEQWCYGVEG
jgi:hypothetical protein